jgi:hypothetical protein
MNYKDIVKKARGENFRLVNLEYSKIVGIKGSLMLDWLLYLCGTHNTDEVYTTYENISEYTTLTINEIKSSQSLLKENNFISYKRKGIPPKNHYKVNFHLIREIQINGISNNQLNNYTISGKPTNQLDENQLIDEMESSSTLKSSNNNSEKENSNNNSNENNFSNIFEDFRIYYRSMGGKVLGHETEFKNFKKHKDWKNEINNLKSGAEKYFHLNKNNDKKFLKHLKTFINNREWEIDFEIVNEEDQLKVFLEKFNEYEIYLFGDYLINYLKMLIDNNWDEHKMNMTSNHLRKYFMNTWPNMVMKELEKATIKNTTFIDFENNTFRMQDFEERQWKEEFANYDKIRVFKEIGAN